MSGTTDFYNRFLYGDCRCVLDGDSRCVNGGNLFYDGFCQNFGTIDGTTPRFKGMTSTPFGVNNQTMVISDTNPTTPVGFGDVSVVSGATRNWWPALFAELPNKDTTFGTLADGTVISNWYCFGAGSPNKRQLGGTAAGDWYTGKVITARMGYLGETSFAATAMRATATDGAGTHVDFSPSAAAGTIQYQEVTVPSAVTGAPASFLCNTSFAIQGGTTSGKNFYAIFCRERDASRDNLPGLELASLSVANSTVADHVNPSKVSSAARLASVITLNLNTVIIWLGTNDDVVGLGLAAWQSLVQSLVNSWVTAFGNASVTDYMIHLVVDVENGFNSTAKCLIMEQAITNIASTNGSKVTMTNLFRLSGGPGSAAVFNAAGYYSDTVHPTLAGSLYFTGLFRSKFIQGLHGFSLRRRTGGSRRGLGPR